MFRRVGVRRLCLALLGAGSLALSASPSRAYDALYVFGDSLSDVGNVYAATGGQLPLPPYQGGRFTNGPVWAETLSNRLNLGALKPSLSGGTDYAYGYATASSAVPGHEAGIPTVQQQVDSYAIASGGKADASSLFAVWIGANDVLNVLNAIALGQLTIEQAQVDLATSAKAEVEALKTLDTLGADHLLVGLVPDIGLTPRLNTTAPQLGTALSAYYNQQLVDAAHTALPHRDLTYFDTFSLLNAAAANPYSFGFTDVTSACFLGTFTSGGAACASPNTWLFWDTIHPTTAGHTVIADLAASVLPHVTPVPLPDGAPLFGFGLVALGAVAARRRRGSDQPA